MTLKNKWFSVKNARKYFRTCQSLGAADIHGWRGCEHALYLFMDNDTELYQLILDELIFPYIMGKFLSLIFCLNLRGASCLRFSRKMAVFAPSVRTLWRRCAARLAYDCTRDAAHKYFTTTYPNYMQCAGGLQDGATRCEQLLNMLHDLPVEDQDQDDPIAVKALFASCPVSLCLNTSVYSEH
jgi:hypothetical protein